MFYFAQALTFAGAVFAKSLAYLKAYMAYRLAWVQLTNVGELISSIIAERTVHR